MYQKQNIRLNMLLTVLRVLEANASIFAANIFFNIILTAFKASIAELRAAIVIQESDNTGVTEDKLISKEDICDMAIVLAGIIVAYATENNNRTLKNSVNFSHSEIFYQRGENVLATAQKIYDVALENRVVLLPAGVDDDLLEMYTDSLEAFKNLLHAPRTAQTTRGSHTVKVDRLFGKLDVTLKLQLDKLVMRYKKSHPDFFEAYKIARIIVDGPSTARDKPNEEDPKGSGDTDTTTDPNVTNSPDKPDEPTPTTPAA